jgi:type I restriction enzyme R subunit
MKPSEHKTVQARILEYAEVIGWALVSREVAEARRGKNGGQECPPSLFFEDVLHAKVQEFNPRYAEAEGALTGKLRHLHSDIYGNREFVEHLRNRGKFFDHEEKRERDLILIDYEHPERNVYEVTEEWAYHNGHYGTREDMVFLINGIPVLGMECKNATKDEGIALGIDQIRLAKLEKPRGDRRAEQGGGSGVRVRGNPRCTLKTRDPGQLAPQRWLLNRRSRFHDLQPA